LESHEPIYFFSFSKSISISIKDLLLKLEESTKTGSFIFQYQEYSEDQGDRVVLKFVYRIGLLTAMGEHRKET
jgi:hypothetical protein